jgi:tyrosine-protein phosphatase SIW14
MSDSGAGSRHARRAGADRRRRLVAICLIAALPSLAEAARPIACDAKANAHREAKPYSDSLEARGIGRFAVIERGLARGGQPSAEGLRTLRDLGYRTVISFRKNPAERRRLERMGIRYVEIPMRAGLFGAAPPSDRDVAQFLSIVADSTQRPVFIHCRHGKDRTGAMAAIYRIAACGWTKEEAVDEMQAFGFSDHYRTLMRYVRAFADRHHGLEDRRDSG